MASLRPEPFANIRGMAQAMREPADAVERCKLLSASNYFGEEKAELEFCKLQKAVLLGFGEEPASAHVATRSPVTDRTCSQLLDMIENEAVSLKKALYRNQ